MKVLVTAASQQGATSGIAEAIGRTLRARGLDATAAEPDEIVDVAGYDALVIGSAIYAGHWLDTATISYAVSRRSSGSARSGCSPVDRSEIRVASSCRR